MTARRQTGDSFARRNGLSLVFGALMLATIVGHALTGWRVDAEAREAHGEPLISLVQYLGSSQFLSTLLENWESEFLQMGLFVVGTVAIRQKGSSESRPMRESEEKPRKYSAAERPWPVRRGGIWLRLYEHSLSGALFLLFALSFAGHGYNSWKDHREEALAHGQVPHSLAEHWASADLWFESFQNWQSEFLSIVALVLLSIHLREKDSPQSKPVEAPHSHTGD